MNHVTRKSHRLRKRTARPYLIEQLEDRRLLAFLPRVALDLHATDLAGNPLPNNQVAVGDDFLLRASVQDLRADPTGVFAGFFDVAYDNPSVFSVVLSEVQRVLFSPDTTGGTYQLTFDGETSGNISFGPEISDTVANMQAGLEALSTIGPGNVEITHDPFINDSDPSQNNLFRFDIKFVNDLAEMDLDNIIGDAAGLTVSEGSPSILIEEHAKPLASDPEGFRRAFVPGPEYPHGLQATLGDLDPQTLEVIDPNVFNEVGALAGLGFPTGTGGFERLEWTVRLNADAIGDVTFSGNAPDESPRTEVLLFEEFDGVPESELQFNSVTVSIVGSVDTTGRIKGQKFFDEDGDGLHATDENGVDGITIELVDPATGNVIDTTTTTSIDGDFVAGINPVVESGLYSFDVAPGIYEVREAFSPTSATSLPPSGGRYLVEVGPGETVGVWPFERVIHCSADFSLGNWVGTCNPSDSDQYFASAVVEIDLPDSGPLDNVADATIFVAGPTTVFRGTPRDRDVEPMLDIEIVSMRLLGNSPIVGDITVQAGDGVGNLEDDGPLHSPGLLRQFSPSSPVGFQSLMPSIQLDIPDRGLMLNSSDLNMQGLAGQYIPYYQPTELTNPISLEDPLGNEQARVLSVVLTPQYGVDFGNQPQTATFDFGDAPDPDFATQLPSGASHTLGSGLVLGAMVDGEADGQPNATATGDDASGSDDEDGVQQLAATIATSAEATTSSFLVTASAPAKLDAWIDFDGNGQFDHPSEHLGQGTSIDVASGDNLVSYVVPAGAQPGDTFARFRLSSAGGLAPGGAADDGEVEDYQHTILDGDLGAAAFVELLAGDVDVAAAESDVAVSNGDAVLFQAPGSAVTGLEFRGTLADNTVELGNLSSVLTSPIPLGFDGAEGSDILRLTGSDQTLDLTDNNNSILNVEEIDIIGASPNALILDGASVENSTESANTLIVRHDEDDTVTYAGAGWDVQAPIFTDGGQRHLLVNGAARVETINTLPWQNPLSIFDTNFNEDPTSLDALLIINFIGRSGDPPIQLNAPTSAEELPEQYVDVNGSGTATSLDALRVINFLGQVGDGESQANGELIALPTWLGFAGVESQADTADDLVSESTLLQRIDRVISRLPIRDKHDFAVGIADLQRDLINHLAQQASSKLEVLAVDEWFQQLENL